jgi:hypothetical protein
VSECESQRLAVGPEDVLDWSPVGGAGGGAAGDPSSLGVTVSDAMMMVEGAHETSGVYNYNERLDAPVLTVTVSQLPGPILLIENAGTAQCGPEELEFSAIVNFSTADGLFDETSTTTVRVKADGRFSTRLNIAGDKLAGDFDPSAIAPTDASDVEVSLFVTYEKHLGGNISLSYSREMDDGVGADTNERVMTF